MNRKIKFLKIAICVVFLALAIPPSSFGWPWTTPASQIESVLNKCAAVSKKASGTQASPAQIAAFVADNFQKIDATACPEDFRVAFQTHIIAWLQLQNAYANNNVVNNVLEGAIAAVSDNPSMLGQTLMAPGEAEQKVNETYSALTIIAAKYGARIPRSVVE